MRIATEARSDLEEGLRVGSESNSVKTSDSSSVTGVVVDSEMMLRVAEPRKTGEKDADKGSAIRNYCRSPVVQGVECVKDSGDGREGRSV